MITLEEKFIPSLKLSDSKLLASDHKWETANIFISDLKTFDQKKDFYRGLFYEVRFFCNAVGSFHANSQRYPVHGNQVVFSLPGMIRSWEMDANETDGYIIMFSEEFFKKDIKNYNYLLELPYFQINSDPSLCVTDTSVSYIRNIFNTLFCDYHSDKAEKDNFLRLYLHILLLELEQQYNKTINEMSYISRQIHLVNKFKYLINKHYRSKRSLKEYADMLNISHKYLSDVIKKNTGITPYDHFKELIISEAKVLLRETDLSIAEIAYYLQFEDPSYFTRFFKKSTKISPILFRGNSTGIKCT